MQNKQTEIMTTKNIVMKTDNEIKHDIHLLIGHLNVIEKAIETKNMYHVFIKKERGRELFIGSIAMSHLVSGLNSKLGQIALCKNNVLELTFYKN